MYKAVGFDLGGVIIYYSIPEELENIAPQLGVTLPALRESFKKWRPPVDRGEIDNATFWANFIKDAGSDADPAATEYLWIENYVTKNPLTPGMIELVDQLKAAGYKVGALSNIDPKHGQINYQRHFFNHFDTVLLSYEIKSRKPEPEAFQMLADRLGVKPAELIFVDDTAENVTGANQFGSHGILFPGRTKLVAELHQLGLKF